MLGSLGLSSWRELNVAEIRKLGRTPGGSVPPRWKDGDVLVVPFEFLESLSELDSVTNVRSLRLPPGIKNVFLVGFKPLERLERTILEMFLDKKACLRHVATGSLMSFSRKKDICGAFSGLEIQCQDPTPSWGLSAVSLHSEEISPILQSDGAYIMLCLKQQGLNVYMLLTSKLADIEQIVSRNLEVRQCLLGLVAPYMMLKYLLHGSGWLPGPCFANIIFDDPPLARKYGLADFRIIAERLVERRLAMTLAFIPWNYRRGTKRSIDFFKDAQNTISICIHGCNHTKSEFGGSDEMRLNGLAALAVERMEALKRRTGLSYSRSMVFPQGRFSARAMAALKQNDYLAVFNTELKDATGEIQVRVKDLLHPAVMNYHCLPLFLRRKLCDGFPNLALDLLFNKPCIIVTHHDDYQENHETVWRLADLLNEAQPRLEWQSLTHIATHCNLLRRTPFGEYAIHTFARTVNLDILNEHPKANCMLVKQETHPKDIRAVLPNGEAAQTSIVDVGIAVRIPEDSGIRSVEFVFQGESVPSNITLSSREYFSAWLRRSLSEARDNYLSRSRALKWIARFVKRKILGWFL